MKGSGRRRKWSVGAGALPDGTCHPPFILRMKLTADIAEQFRKALPSNVCLCSSTSTNTTDGLGWGWGEVQACWIALGKARASHTEPGTEGCTVQINLKVNLSCKCLTQIDKLNVAHTVLKIDVFLSFARNCLPSSYERTAFRRASCCEQGRNLWALRLEGTWGPNVPWFTRS